MNFLRGLAKYISNQPQSQPSPQTSPPFTHTLTREPSSSNFQIIVIDQDEQPTSTISSLVLPPTTLLPSPLPPRDPTRYYMIQNQFFNNIIVQKDHPLQTLSPSQWSSILSSKSLSKICQKNLIFSILKGIPSQIRKEFWQILADTDKIKSQMKLNYYELLQKGAQKGCKNLDIIVKDVPRTKVPEEHREKLKNILIAYSTLDEYGYTQGMNLICGSLLNILSWKPPHPQQTDEVQHNEIGFQQKVFWVFIGIMYNKNWRECFIDMLGVKRMLGELESLMAKYTPEILWHINHLELDLNMCFAQYYLTLIIYNTPIEFATIILDLFLLEGEKVIHSVILKMLMGCREKIMGIEDMGVLIRFFKVGMLEYCDGEMKRQGEEARGLEDFIINFFTLSSG